MRQHFPALIAGLLAGGIAAAGVSIAYRPKPVVVQPQTTVISRAQDRVGANPTKSEQRRISAAWGDLTQPEIDALTAELKKISKSEVVIFCMVDEYCADLGLDLENAFESAHWTVKQERPFADDTVGIKTSREDIAKAIEAATSGRLKVSAGARQLQVLPTISSGGTGTQPLGANMRAVDVIALGKKPK